MLGVFVNSSDGFCDCWESFFHLFLRFAGDLVTLPIYLNTEKKEFFLPGLRIVPTRVCKDAIAQSLSWSACLRRGVHAVHEDYLLYFQEDYFLRQPVDCGLIQRALHALISDPTIAVVYLNSLGPHSKRSRRYDEDFIEIQGPTRYLASTQAAVWRKDALVSLLRDWENGWMFEIFGSRRALRSSYKFLAINRDRLRLGPTVEYVNTGVIKGKWKEEALNLLAEYGISIDVSKRGVYREGGRLKTRAEVAWKLASDPFGLLRSTLGLIGEQPAAHTGGTLVKREVEPL